MALKKLHNYINRLDYGNKDLLGNSGVNVGQNDGLMNAWLGSSLKISPIEQVNFLEKLLQKSLLVTQQAQLKTIDLLKIDSFDDDWKLHGKTGGGSIGGWFIGWIHKIVDV